MTYIILSLFAEFCLGTAIIIYAVRHLRKARREYLQTKAECEDEHYNHEAEKEEAISMYENGQAQS